MERCGLNHHGDHTHQYLAHSECNEIIDGECSSCILPTIPFDQSGDLDETCDRHATTGKTSYARNVVNSNSKHNSQQHLQVSGELISLHTIILIIILYLRRGSKKSGGTMMSTLHL